MADATGDLFFRSGALDRQRAEALLAEALTGADDGELFLEFRQSEALVFDDGRLRSASFDTSQGFGTLPVECAAPEEQVARRIGHR